MSEVTSSLLGELAARGFVQQCTDWPGLDGLLAQAAPVAAYIGFDATAQSLHVGSLLPLMLLRKLQQHGHKPVVLLGGGTTLVGDPSGRDSQRQLLDQATIQGNIAGIRRVVERFVAFGDGPSDAVLVDNADWLTGLGYIDFLRTVGAQVTVNRMLSFESVRLRLEREQPLSFLEFNYMLLQAYDFLELYRKHGVRLQMGGGDQWGNIVCGIDLLRRFESVEGYGLTTPLLTTAAGHKMGKTAGGAVWLDSADTSDFDYWQYWRNVADADVGRFLRLFTELPLERIAELERREGAELNAAKKELADAATALCRGEEAAERAHRAAEATFEAGGASLEELPRVERGRAQLEAGVAVAELLVELGLCASKGAARRLIQQGGARLNNDRVSDPHAVVTPADLDAHGTAKLSAGKKKHGLVVQTD